MSDSLAAVYYEGIYEKTYKTHKNWLWLWFKLWLFNNNRNNFSIDSIGIISLGSLGMNFTHNRFGSGLL